MKMKELEKLTGLPKSKIRYYERIGLLCPSRKENNYREYDQGDVAKLHDVVFLCDLGLNLEDVKLIMKQKLSLQDSLDNYINQTKEQLSILQDRAEKQKMVKDALEKEEGEKRAFPFYHYLVKLRLNQKFPLTMRKAERKYQLYSLIIFTIICFLIITSALKALSNAGIITYQAYFLLIQIALSIAAGFLLVVFINGKGGYLFDDTSIYYMEKKSFIKKVKIISSMMMGRDISNEYKRLPYREIKKMVLDYRKITSIAPGVEASYLPYLMINSKSGKKMTIENE